MCESAWQWTEANRGRGTFWEHSGDPREPHLVLPSGEHVSLYFDHERAMKDPVLPQKGIEALLKHLSSSGLDLSTLQRVLSVGRGASRLAQTAAHLISTFHPSDRDSKRCYSAHLDEPWGVAGRRAGTRVPCVEEGEHTLILMESFSPAAARGALESLVFAQARPARIVGALVNFSGMVEIGNYTVGALITRDISRWACAEACRLCERGSPIVPQPQSKEEWNRLLVK